jgi:predicted XRE-type DNA-binding protein
MVGRSKDKKTKEIPVEVGSKNVFKDLDFSNAEERLAKAELAMRLNVIIKQNNLTQTEASKVLGISQAKVSLLSRGVVSGFSLEKLMKLLNKFGCDVDIVVHDKSFKKSKTKSWIGGGHLKVIYV